MWKCGERCRKEHWSVGEDEGRFGERCKEVCGCMGKCGERWGEVRRDVGRGVRGSMG